jgi:hypothetical protein
VQDFYAHSNYIELYIQFYKSKGGKMEEFDIETIPIYTELDEDAQNFMERNGLRTGFWDNDNNETWFDFKFGDGPWKSDPNSHYNMNKDSDESVQGSKVIEGTENTLFEAAKTVAEKHTVSIIKENTEGQNDEKNTNEETKEKDL